MTMSGANQAMRPRVQPLIRPAERESHERDPSLEVRRRARARRPGAESPTKAPNIAPPAPRCSPRRSNCVAISSASPPSAARCRRAAPVIGDYRFEGEDGPTDFAGLFGDKQTLAIYSYMFGPRARAAVPDVHQPLGAWEGNAADIGQRISLAVVARSPIERLIAWKKERGWRDLRLYQRPQRRLFARLFRPPARTARKSRPSTSSPAATGRSAISGRAR